MPRGNDSAQPVDLPERIYLTPSGSHEVKYRENGRQRTKTFKKLKRAVEFLAEVDGRQERGKRVHQLRDVPTLEEFTTKTLATWTHLEARTLRNYTNDLSRHALPFLGHLKMHPAEMKASTLGDWQEQRLEEGAGISRLIKVQGLLSRICRRAVMPFEYLDQDPVAFLDTPKYQKQAHRWLTAPEVEAMRNWYLERDDVGSATLVSCLAYIGSRPQMFLALTWANLTGNIPRWVRNPPRDAGGLELLNRNSAGEILPGTKTSRGQKSAIYVPSPVLRDLDMWREWSGSLYIFPRAVDGRPWTEVDYHNWSIRPLKTMERTGRKKRLPCFKAAAEAVGVDVTPYGLRHTAASLYAAAGWTHVEIANQLQHSPAVSMDTYQHLLDQAPGDSQLHRSVDDFIWEARGVAPRRVGNGEVLVH